LAPLNASFGPQLFELDLLAGPLAAADLRGYALGMLANPFPYADAPDRWHPQRLLVEVDGRVVYDSEEVDMDRLSLEAIRLIPPLQIENVRITQGWNVSGPVTIAWTVSGDTAGIDHLAMALQEVYPDRNLPFGAVVLSETVPLGQTEYSGTLPAPAADCRSPAPHRRPVRASTGACSLCSQRQARPDQPLGSYSVELPTGTFRASIAASGFATLVDPQPITITAGQTTERDFVLAREAIEPPSDQGIRGTVRLAGPRPTAGSGPQIQVQIIPFGPGPAAGPPLVADAQGRYMRSLVEGRYRVLARAEGYRPARSRPCDVFRGRYTVVNLTLVPLAPPVVPPPLVFLGLVLEAVPGGVKTRPLPGAMVLRCKEGESLLRAQRGTTDEHGEVTLQVWFLNRYVPTWFRSLSYNTYPSS